MSSKDAEPSLSVKLSGQGKVTEATYVVEWKGDGDQSEKTALVDVDSDPVDALGHMEGKEWRVLVARSDAPFTLQFEYDESNTLSIAVNRLLAMTVDTEWSKNVASISITTEQDDAHRVFVGIYGAGE